MRVYNNDFAGSIEDLEFIYSTKKCIDFSGSYAYYTWEEAEFIVENSCEEILLIPASVGKLQIKNVGHGIVKTSELSYISFDVLFTYKDDY